MATKKSIQQYAYGLNNDLIPMAPLPIVSHRSPTAADQGVVGQFWINTLTDQVYCLTSYIGGVNNWSTNPAAGSGNFTDVTVNPGNVDVTAGDINVAAGDIVVTAGEITTQDLTVNGTATFVGAVNQAGATVELEGTGNAANAVLIHATGGVLATMKFENSLGTDNKSILIDSLAGGIAIEAAKASAVAITLTNTVAGGGMTFTGGTAGITETTTGALALDSALASHFTVTGVADLTLSSVGGSVVVDGSEAAADAVQLTASNAAGGILATSGTGGILLTATNGIVALRSGTGAINIGIDAVAHTITAGNSIGATSIVLNTGTGNLDLGVNAIAHTVRMGSVTGVAATLIQSGTGGILQQSNNGTFAIESGTGAINIGVDAVAHTVTIGSATGVSSTVINTGTGNLDLGVTATVHAVRLGSNNGASNVLIQSGTGGILQQSNNGVFAIESGTGAINVGVDAVAHTITLGNAIGATSVVVDSGTGAASFGANATVHATTLGSLTGASATVVQSGTGNLSIQSNNGILALESGTGALNVGVDAVAHIVTIGNNVGATSVVVDCGTGAASFGTTATVHATTVGSLTGASATTVRAGSAGLNLTAANSAINIESGTGPMNVGADATVHTTTVGSDVGASQTNILGGTGGLNLSANGITTVEQATDTQAGAAVTINANVGKGTFQGLVTGAAASQVLTITNALCTATSAILCTVANKGANDAQMTITRVTPAAGSFTVTVTNYGTQALNGDIILAFWIL